MKSNLRRFIVGLLCLVVTLIFLTIAVKNAVPHFVTTLWPLLILFFAIVSVVVYLLTMKVRKDNDIHKFTNFYMGTTIVKLMLYLAIIVIYVLISKNDDKAFIYTFLAYYLCYSVFETYSLTKINRQ